MFKNVDWDVVLGYDTLKLVHIRDRRLGILHYSLQIAIFAYVIYEIFAKQLYLKTEEVTPGGVRVSLQEPPRTSWDTSLFSKPAYCAEKDCSFLGAQQILYPNDAEGSAFITTRISYETYDAIPGCDFLTPNTPQCSPLLSRTPTSSKEYYVANIESFTLLLQHAVRGQANEISVSNINMKGTFVDAKGDTKIQWTTPRSPEQAHLDGDVVSVGDLINMAGLKLDEPSDAPGVSQGETFRRSGAIIVVIIDYENRMSSLTEFKYRYLPNYIPKTEYKALETIFNSTTGAYTIVNRHGVKILFRQTGKVGKFDLIFLLQSLVASIALLKVATLIVELLMTNVLPQRHLYTDAKFEHTVDFQDFRESQKSKEDREEAAPVLVRSESSARVLLAKGAVTGTGLGK